MVHYAIEEGLTAADFKDLPVSIKAMETIRAVPAEHFFDLHERLDKALGPGFSARVGQQMKMEDYGVLGLSWKTCSKAGEIFERCERYFHLLSNTYVFRVNKDGGLSHIHLLRDAHRRGVELSNEATFSATVVVLRLMTETDISPFEVSFKHRPPTALDSYTEAFKCPIKFNQLHNRITYQSADLEMRTAKADISINKFLLERVEEERKGIEIGALRIANDVEALIKDALPSGIPAIGEISSLMGMSTRTLSRRLSDKGITFRELIKNTQQNISKDLLQNSSDTISEIAFQTGFSEQSAFSRAFKKWTGKSPMDYRNPG